MSPLRVGTRGSPLALWQTEWVRQRLANAGLETTPVRIATSGDQRYDIPLSQFGVQAVFSKELDEALLGNRIDLAVHSLKDLPTTLPEGIALAAVSIREDPRDALIGRGVLGFADLPLGATLATSSLRRRAQLLRARPDLLIVDLRGNIGTRIAKLDGTSEWAGIVLASAGLVRLGLEGRIGERFAPALLLPAPGQGALAVTVREDDPAITRRVQPAIDHLPTRLAVAAERAFLGELEGGCQVPVAALAEIVGGGARAQVRLRGRILSLDGQRQVEGAAQSTVRVEEDALALGRSLADRLLRLGGGEILLEIRPLTRSTAN